MHNQNSAPLSEPQNIETLLPNELIKNIFSFLPLANLAQAAQVNKRWQKNSKDNLLWSVLYRRDHQNPTLAEDPKEKNWREVYKSTYSKSLRYFDHSNLLNSSDKTLALIKAFNVGALSRIKALLDDPNFNISSLFAVPDIFIRVFCCRGFKENQEVKDFFYNTLVTTIYNQVQDKGHKNGFTLLHFAVLCEQQEKVKELIEKGWDINAITKGKNYTPLHLALNSKQINLEIVKFLLEKGADVNKPTKFTSETPLHYAASHGHTQAAKLLLEHGASLNVQNNNGETALILVTSHGHADLVALLIINRANKNIKNDNEVTALNIARLHGYNEIAGLLSDTKENNIITSSNKRKFTQPENNKENDQDDSDILSSKYFKSSP